MHYSKVLNMNNDELSKDLLWGADAIAEFVLGDRGRRRQVYHLVQENRLPVFRMGTVICARRSTLIRWVESQENTVMENPDRTDRTTAPDDRLNDEPSAPSAAAVDR